MGYLLYIVIKREEEKYASLLTSSVFENQIVVFGYNLQFDM